MLSGGVWSDTGTFSGARNRLPYYGRPEGVWKGPPLPLLPWRHGDCGVGFVPRGGEPATDLRWAELAHLRRGHLVRTADPTSRFSCSPSPLRGGGWGVGSFPRGGGPS